MAPCAKNSATRKRRDRDGDEQTEQHAQEGPRARRRRTTCKSDLRFHRPDPSGKRTVAARPTCRTRLCHLKYSPPAAVCALGEVRLSPNPRRQMQHAMKVQQRLRTRQSFALRESLEQLG